MSTSILFHRETEWGGRLRGSTNILAEHFARDGFAVTWMTRPVNGLHVVARPKSYGVRQCLAGPMRSDDGVLVVAPFTLVPQPRWRWLGQQGWALQAQAAYGSMVPRLDRLLRSAGQPLPEVIWTKGGDGGALRRYFPRARRIVQCVDLYEAYGGKAQNALERLDYCDADAVVAIGHALAAFLRDERGVPASKLHVIGQGVDLPAYAERRPEPQELAQVPRPRVVWVGLLDKADPSLMEATLDALGDEGSLVLVGPPSAWATDLARRRRRVVMLGPKRPQEVVALLQWCDVGLMLYRRDTNPLRYLGQNPLKLYELAAAGLPILSTPHAEFRYLQPPVLEVEHEREVAPQLRRALTETSALREASLAFASCHGWQARYEEARVLVRSLIEGNNHE